MRYDDMKTSPMERIEQEIFQDEITYVTVSGNAP